MKNVISPVLRNKPGSKLIYITFSEPDCELGGSSFAQVLNSLGDSVPKVKDAGYFKGAFAVVQEMILENQILAGHDVSAGGLVTTLLEMTFASPGTGITADLSSFHEMDIIRLLFSEKPGVVIQVEDDEAVEKALPQAHRPEAAHEVPRLRVRRNQ